MSELKKLAEYITKIAEEKNVTAIRLEGCNHALQNHAEQLAKAVLVMHEALEFYGNRRHWQNMELEDCNDDYENLDLKKPKLITGGKRARNAMIQADKIASGK